MNHTDASRTTPDAPDAPASHAPAPHAPSYPHMPKAGSTSEARLLERLQDPVIKEDCAILGFMTEIYCTKKHADREKSPLSSPAVDAGAYEGRPRLPLLCTECAMHLIYGEIRRALCPYDPKPNCKDCETHCYKPDEAQFQRTSMAFAGPRALLSPILRKDAIAHAVGHLKSVAEKKRRAKKDA